MTCAHCKKRRKLYEWTVRACANNRKKATFGLCNECDTTFNRLILTFCKDPEIDTKMQAYARRP